MCFLFFTHSFAQLETEAWRCGTSQELRNRSGRRVFCPGTRTELPPQSTWTARARTDATERAFPTELEDGIKQSTGFQQQMEIS